MLNAFYLSTENLKGHLFNLDESESHHAHNVFRLGPGDGIYLLNGKGSAYEAIIEKFDNGIISGRIRKTFEQMGENSNEIIIVPAILKRNRFERLIEKATELGVKEIHPVLSENCVINKINLERCNKIILSAAKQCQRSYFPKILEPQSIIQWLKHPKEQCFAGSLNSNVSLKEFKFKSNSPIFVLIGPEGGFSLKEIGTMKEVGTRLFSLGERRLRAETAAQASLSILNEILE